jgi:MerR family transcriptional regulator/heat shock protein HspR
LTKIVQRLTRRRVIKLLELDGDILDRLEELEVVVPQRRPGRERCYGPEDLDCIRVYKILLEDLGVNQAGAEIILRMRGQILQMHRNMAQVFGQMKVQGMLDDFKKAIESIKKDIDF